MAIEGPLKELSIHDVFQLLDLSRKTGVLSVTSQLRHNQGTVYFQNGAVVYAEVQSNEHPLGGLLLRAGKIGEADLQRARDMQVQGDPRRLGEILVAIKAVSPRELERHVRFQIEEVVFELMSWSEGHFSFVEGPPEEVGAEATVGIRTEALLMEGARRIDEWSNIEGKIPHLGVVPVLATAVGDEPAQMDLLPAEWEVLAAIDGDNDIRRIAEIVGRAEFDVAKTVFGLESAGIVSVTDPRQRRAASADESGNVDDLISRAAGALDGGDVEGARGWAESARSQYPDVPVVYLLLGQVGLARGRVEEAEEHLRRALRLDPLLTPAHRLLGDALALRVRFQEASDWWQRWLTIGEHDHGDPAESEQVRKAVEAAQTLGALLRYPNG